MGFGDEQSKTLSILVQWGIKTDHLPLSHLDLQQDVTRTQTWLAHVSGEVRVFLFFLSFQAKLEAFLNSSLVINMFA